ncbi:hypothetical protein D3C75_1040140 [compost metagenome]
MGDPGAGDGMFAGDSTEGLLPRSGYDGGDLAASSNHQPAMRTDAAASAGRAATVAGLPGVNAGLLRWRNIDAQPGEAILSVPAAS